MAHFSIYTLLPTTVKDIDLPIRYYIFIEVNSQQIRIKVF